MEADSTAAGELCSDVIATESCGVVADVIDFICPRRLDVAQVERTGDRSDKNVAVLALCSAQMQMREAENHATARVTEAGAPPIEGFHVGTDFDQTIGDRGADKGVAAPVDTDEWVDVVGVVRRGLGGGSLCNNRTDEQKRTEREVDRRSNDGPHSSWHLVLSLKQSGCTDNSKNNW